MAAQAKSNAYAGFGGKVGKIFSTSEPEWPAEPTAPAGAPNILVMLADDLGFADLGCYGSEIDTPELDRLAADGVRYTNFHVNPMCSPTRASMLTGLNHHMAGMGHVAHFDPGYPGYAMRIRENATTMGDMLGSNGWASFMVGKWHLCKDADMNEGGNKISWPLQKGFEKYYGILGGFTNFHQPHHLVRDNHHLDIDDYPDGYYFTDDLTDQAIDMIRTLRANNPNKPWFMYFAHGAVHAPLQAKAADIEKYRDKYNAGWDHVRQLRYERQKDLGVIAADTVLPPRNTEEGHAVKAWDELSQMEKETFARYQEIFAGMVDNIDQNFGRLRTELEKMGEWENTIVVFTSDNGGSREGQEDGTSAYFRTLLLQANRDSLESVELDHSRLDLMGGPQTLPHYNMGWAMVSSAPFRMYKINTHQGGHQVPLIVSWPSGLRQRGEIRTQYQHVTDLLPTLAEMIGVEVPTEKHGQPLPAPAGASFAATFENADEPSTHREQYYEMIGHRGYYRDGWSAVTLRQPQTPFSEEAWELHNLADDPTESHNLAGEHPDKVAELTQAFDDAAWANQVYPLDEGNFVKAITKPEWYDTWSTETTIWPGTPSLERWRSSMLVFFRSFTITVDLDWSAGDQGTLVAHGDQGGGYGLYVIDDHLHYRHNAYGSMTRIDCGAVPVGARQITAAFEAAGGGVWNITVAADGVELQQIPGMVQLAAMAPFQGIDVGIDRRSPVCWEIFEAHRTFPYTGTLHKVTYTPGELAPDAGARWLDALRDAGTRFE